MLTIFGNYVEPQECQESLRVSLSSSVLPLQRRWLNNSLTANFLADYWSTFFISWPVLSRYPLANLKQVISYIVNELLDNAVKFGVPDLHSSHRMLIVISQAGEYLRFHVTNNSNPEKWRAFQEYIKILLTEDTETLYFRQMEKNAAFQEHAISRLGLLSILHDYHGQAAWKFEEAPHDPEDGKVTIMVQVPMLHQTY
jgi:hypothetical protein